MSLDKNDLATGAGLRYFVELRSAEADWLIGRRIGEYEITGVLGHGGMGLVLRGRRSDGSFDRDVAVKLAPFGGLIRDESTTRRALLEQRVLAGLNHPNICLLYDAGRTEEGWPYLVMELVDGSPIDEYCARERLSVDEVLRLFDEMLDAVAYAHARLVIHRDIKPSNALVSVDGHVKLLDFGIAKLLSEEAGAITQDLAPLSPLYASPEQLLGQPITIASDVYQLGALLAQLLLGRPLRSTYSVAEALEFAGGNGVVDIDDGQWRKLPRDLRRIVEQCIRHEATERYPDVNALRRDLELFRRGFPIAAVGDSAFYRARKFATRNAPALGMTVAVLVGLASLTGWYTVNVAQARNQAELEASLARETADFLIDTFAAANPQVAGRPDVTVKEVLAERAQLVEGGLASQPETRARMFVTIARAYQKLGEYETGLEWAIKAERLSSASDDLRTATLFDAQSLRISILFDLARYDEIERLLPRHVRAATQIHGQNSEQAWMARNRQAALAYFRGDYDAANELVAEVHAGLAELLGLTHKQTLLVAGNMVAFLYASGRHRGALEVARDSYRAASEVLPETNQQVLALLHNMATAAGALGDHEEALMHYRDYRDRVEGLFGEDHITVINANRGIATQQAHLGRNELAAELQRRVIDAQTIVLGANHPETLSERANYANNLAQIGMAADALAILEEVIPKQRQALGAGSYPVLSSMVQKSDVLFILDDPDAERFFVTTRRAVAESLHDEHYLMASLDEIWSTHTGVSAP